MDGEVVIKEEPFDWDDGADFFDCDSQIYNMQQGIHQIRDQAVEKTSNVMALVGFQTPSGETAVDATIYKRSENIITVNVAETVKTEDEISFIKQVTAEENRMHDPALIMPTDLELYAKGIKSKTMPKMTALHKCRKGCDKVFRTLTERAFHETQEHKQPRYIKCNFCNETLENFFALTRHMAEHRNEQRYICSHCSQNFHSFVELQTHWKTSNTCKNGEEKHKIGTSLKQSLKEINIKASNLAKQNDLLQKNAAVKSLSKLFSDSANVASSSSPQPLSFAEEVKAFTAKYQLKTVAKKRTSAFTLQPPQKGKLQKFVGFDIKSTYAVPTAISNFSCPLQNIKIKEEPMDEEEMATTVSADFFDSIQIKNEPHDDYEDLITKNLILSEETTKSKVCDQYLGDIAVKSDVKNEEPLREIEPAESSLTALNSFRVAKINATGVKTENDISVACNPVTRTLETIDTSNQQHPQPHPKVLLSKANLLAMKNVKILKLGPLAKIVKLSPQAASSRVGSPEEKKTEIQNKTDNQLIRKVNMNAMQALSPEQIKVKNLKREFPEFPENTDDKGNVLFNTVESLVKITTKTKRTLPQWVIRYMEEQPQKRKIIDDLQRQFYNANEIMKLTTFDLASDNPVEMSKEEASVSPPAKNEFITPEPFPPLPESFFLKVTDNIDKELMKARLQYSDHYYAWICPMCYKEYTQKHIFINHLIGTHKISADKLKTFTVEVKPLLLTTVKPEPNLSSINKRDIEKKVTTSILKPRYECSKCHLVYWTKQGVIDHGNSDCGRLPLFVCAVCSKPFASRSTLNCHMTIHTGELPYKCKYCDKRFRTNGQVRVHHRKHTGEKPFTCQICALSFTHRETLISHMSRHMDIKRYICKGCNKRFSTISALTTHRNVRPTTCGTLELDTQAVGPLIRVTNGQLSFEPQHGNNARKRRKFYQEILTEIQNIPKTEALERHEQHIEGSNPPNEC